MKATKTLINKSSGMFSLLCVCVCINSVCDRFIYLFLYFLFHFVILVNDEFVLFVVYSPYKFNIKNYYKYKVDYFRSDRLRILILFCVHTELSVCVCARAHTFALIMKMIEQY